MANVIVYIGQLVFCHMEGMGIFNIYINKLISWFTRTQISRVKNDRNKKCKHKKKKRIIK